MIDYQAIIDNLTPEVIINLMTKLGADRYDEKEKFIIFPTICHNESAADASMKLYYYKENKMFVCYSNCQSMSVFKFLKTYYETRGIDYNWYEDIYQVLTNNTTSFIDYTFEADKYHSLNEQFAKKKKDVFLPKYNPNVLDCFTKIYPTEWLADGITGKAMDKYNILYSISQNKIIIPHYSINGELCGIRGRALNAWEIENIGKYMPVQIEQKWYSHPLSMNLYGLYENKDNIKTNHICYIFESEKAVLQFEDFNTPHCAVAVCGSQFNKYQLNLLMKHCHPSEIVICFDKEELPGEEKYFNKLWNICSKYINYAQFSFIYDRENLLALKESPTDRGEEVFEKLLAKRVRVN